MQSHLNLATAVWLSFLALAGFLQLCQQDSRSTREIIPLRATAPKPTPKVIVAAKNDDPIVQTKEATRAATPKPTPKVIVAAENENPIVQTKEELRNDKSRSQFREPPAEELCTAGQKSCSLVVAKGDAAPRPHRHILVTLCGALDQYHVQTVRLVKSIILSQSSRFSKGNFNYDIWLLLDREAFDELSKRIGAVQLPAQSDGVNAQVKVHLLLNEELEARHGALVKQIPFEPCHTYFLFAGDVLPPSVEEVVIFGCDQVVVDDLERLWESAVKMGWDGDKMFAVVEEKVQTDVYLARFCKAWPDQPRCHPSNFRRDPDLRPRTHWFFLNGVATGSHLMSLANARKYDLAGWIHQTVKLFGPSSFVLGDMSIVNRYGMEHPERMIIQQCHVDVRAIGRCDVRLHLPVVVHGTGQRFSEERPSWDKRGKSDVMMREMKIWHRYGLAVDKVFTSFQARGHKILTRNCLRNEIDRETAQDLWSTIGFAFVKHQDGRKANYGAMSPMIKFPPITSHANTSNHHTWLDTYLYKFLNKKAVFQRVIATCAKTCPQKTPQAGVMLNASTSRSP